MPISKNQIKLISSLHQKKYRLKEELFIVEGIKVVNEFLASDFKLDALFCVIEVTKNYEQYNHQLINNEELKKISGLKSPNKVLAVFKMPKFSTQLKETLGLKVMLDGINDPGNLGTIIRLCDWFGVEELICSKDTVDCYNPKVVQSTMGSLTRVVVRYLDLEVYIKESHQPFYIADMYGENVYHTQLPKTGVLVMGNEANGVGKNIQQLIENKLSIPRFGSLQATESLNVATATAILLSEFRRTTEKLK